VKNVHDDIFIALFPANACHFLVIVAVINPFGVANFSVHIFVGYQWKATYLGAAIGMNTSALALRRNKKEANVS
jgi:hypothetical protein